MNFSILIPTYGRVDLLRGLLSNIRRSTLRIEIVEALVGYDDDDPDMLPAAECIASEFPFASMVLYSPPLLNVNTCYNRLAERSCGRFLIAVNDDAEFITHGWDGLAFNLLEEYLADKPDGIVYGWINDGHHPDETPEQLSSSVWTANCCFPLISRPAWEVMGCFLPDVTPHHGADIALSGIFSAIGRRCDLSVVEIRHHHDAGNVTRRSPSTPAPASYSWEPPEIVERLVERIEVSK